MEIERKFLVHHPLPLLENGKKIIQGYIFIDGKKEMRIRRIDDQAFLTIKIKIDERCREEFEYSIPYEEGEKLLEKGTIYPPIEKTRYVVKYEKMDWEVDVFEESNQGLILAEVELNYPDQELTLPPWIRQEVTHDLKYFNSALQKNPFQNWSD